MEGKIYNLIIIDASGSMDSIYRQALSGLNETIQTIKKAQKEMPEMEQRITMVSFNSGKEYLKEICVNMPALEVKELTEKDYEPDGCTALYDAIGTMVTRMQEVKTHNDQALVTIITDGYENSSQRWNAATVKALVTELRQMGWTFTYIGANQDAVEEAEKIGVCNSLNFSASEEGTREMFAKESSCRRKFYKQKLMERMCDHDMASIESRDFFED